MLAHLPLDSVEKTADITMEQELSRPYVYTAHRLTPSGVDIISVKDPAKPQILWSWRIENGQLHRGPGALNTMYLKSKGRYYLTDAFQFQQGGPDVDLCAVVWDITGLPDTSKIKELARIRIPQYPGGCHESYSYKHSNGQALLVTVHELDAQPRGAYHLPPPLERAYKERFNRSVFCHPAVRAWMVHAAPLRGALIALGLLALNGLTTLARPWGRPGWLAAGAGWRVLRLVRLVASR